FPVKKRDERGGSLLHVVDLYLGLVGHRCELDPHEFLQAFGERRERKGVIARPSRRHYSSPAPTSASFVGTVRMDLLAAATQGFQTVDAQPEFRSRARDFLRQWLTG